MEKNGVLLSICIPTFNRAPLLEQTLASITAQAAFAEGDAIEIVISDNHSTDGTEAVVAPYLRAFPEKIFYHRPPEATTSDFNFGFVLSKAGGAFLKLHNDNLTFRNGTLAEMLKVIAATEAEKPVLFFTNGHMHQGQPIEAVTGVSNFVRRVSFYSTWIGAFGIWREQFDAMPDFGRYAKLRLVQTDILLRLLASGKRAVILFEAYFAGTNVGRKGGYNIAEVFGQNYLSILKEYLPSGLLEREVYEAEKKEVLIKHIIPFYFDANHDFHRTGFFSFLQDYAQDAYFHQAVEQRMDAALKAEQAAPVPAPAPGNPAADFLAQMNAHWRARNPHNETRLARLLGPFNFDHVSVGRKSYGPLHVWSFGRDSERLRIGSFVSIAEDVTFVLGGNHPYQGFSTYPFLAQYFGVAAESASKGEITIGDDVWIGFNATILSGVTVGQGAVIAAGSMVTRDVPPYAVIGGNPARVIKYRFAPEVVARLCRVDFNQLSDEAILANREVLYEALTAENVEAVLARLLP